MTDCVRARSWRCEGCVGDAVNWCSVARLFSLVSDETPFCLAPNRDDVGALTDNRRHGSPWHIAVH